MAPGRVRRKKKRQHWNSTAEAWLPLAYGITLHYICVTYPGKITFFFFNILNILTVLCIFRMTHTGLTKRFIFFFSVNKNRFASYCILDINIELLAGWQWEIPPLRLDLKRYHSACKYASSLIHNSLYEEIYKETENIILADDAIQNLHLKTVKEC